jgi:two-component system nitrogen regulation response regulator GlnG
MNSPKKILIVDDDRDFADSLTEVLELHGHSVTVLPGGEPVVTNYDENDFDLSFIDIRLSGMSGLECLRALRAVRPNANIVMMTGDNTEQYRQEAMDAGALQVLQKPFDPYQLLEIVKHNFSTSGNVT